MPVIILPLDLVASGHHAQGEQAAFDWLRSKTDARVAGLRAEVAAIEAILAEAEVVLLRTTVGVQPLRARARRGAGDQRIGTLVGW